MSAACRIPLQCFADDYQTSHSGLHLHHRTPNRLCGVDRRTDFLCEESGTAGERPSQRAGYRWFRRLWAGCSHCHRLRRWSPHARPVIRERTVARSHRNRWLVRQSRLRSESRGPGSYARSVNADAFSDATKTQIAHIIRADLGPPDLLVFSIAAPVRTDPVNGRDLPQRHQAGGSGGLYQNVERGKGDCARASIWRRPPKIRSRRR